MITAKVTDRTGHAIAASAALVLFLPLLSCAQSLSDKEITDAIKTEYFIDRTVSVSNVRIQTRDGVVTLSGSADNLLEKDRATELAESNKGVRAVVNNLNVKAIARTDEEIKRDIQTLFEYDAVIEEDEVKADVRDAVVTLTGRVQSFQEKEVVGDVVKGVKGVKEIRNEIGVVYGTKRQDAEIRADVQRRIESDLWLNDDLIDLHVNAGLVTLTGEVGSAAEKRRAARLALVAGVHRVNTDGLGVSWWARDPNRRRREVPNRSDEEIAQAVKDAFRYDPRVVSFNPTVRVDKGVVTLTGTVNHLAAKRAAEQDAKNTVGVQRVENRLAVRPLISFRDPVLAGNVRDALLWDPLVDQYQMNVSAQSGRVTLAGIVDSWYEKWHAENVASGIPGVIEVRNNLSVSSASAGKSDVSIKKDVEYQLFWSPFVDADQVKVTVRDGVATLTGTVNSWSERGSAADNAYQGGAREVVNNLNVKGASVTGSEGL